MLVFCACLPATAQALPERFTESAAITGLNVPTAVAFAPDGHVFVAEKRGVIKVFDGLDDPSDIAARQLGIIQTEQRREKYLQQIELVNAEIRKARK